MPAAAEAQTVEFTRVLPAPPAAVWERLTDPAHLREWFAEHAQVDPRHGGAFRFWGKHTAFVPDSRAAAQTITRLDPPSALSFVWPWGGARTEVRIELTPDGDTGTRLHVVHALLDGAVAGFSPAESRFFIEDFWGVALGNLREHLRSGRPALRPDFSIPGSTARVSIEIDAPRERVWRALTTPGEMDRWLSKAAVADLRPGGAYTYGWEFDGEACGPTRILELDPPRRLVHDWQYQAHGASRTEWTLDALTPTRTRVTIAQIGVKSDRDHTGYTGGWAKFAVALRELLEGDA
jgi:uncharacterized protein YndB with AHSA1/START domain